ncbi:MAG: putative baseplate assembly protein [Candidatus Brocadia sp.]|nr:putative baseplate assembly protein [Candidatus Brocadia sp.]
MKIEPPKIDARKFSNLLNTLKRMIPHYTPEWPASDEKDPGIALLKIFSHISESVINRLNQVPHKNLVAFLDMLGIKLLPAQSARAPLTFKLAKGTDKEILIPARTQAATDKTEEHEELPFETERNLWATPSQLIQIISVDPLNDAIYAPPPGFLNEDQKKQNQITYKIASSPSAGAKDFQLDHVTDLKEGDILKISGVDKKNSKDISFLCSSDGTSSDAESKPEYVVISGISGNIVKITDKLSVSYPAGTSVEKVTKFNLFEGKNIQEHSLYLGHKDLFNIKSKGEIILEVTLAPGTEMGNTSLNLIWEYWGEDKDNKKEGWIELQVQGDEAQGLAQSGEISLLKTVEGEIKEDKLGDVFKKTTKRDIGDQTFGEIKTRWIRCRLSDALTAGSSIKLPTFDNIFLKTKPSNNIAPDAGFFNDVPLDWTLIPIEATVIECPGPVISIMSATPPDIGLDSVEGFRKDDEVIVVRDGKIEKEASIGDIEFNLKKVKLSYKDTFQCQIDDVIKKTDTVYKVYPFGKQPKLYDAFYIGSQEALSKKGAVITLSFSLTHLDTSKDIIDKSKDLTPPPDPKLSWEYWNGKGWQSITIIKDDTDRFLNPGDDLSIGFYCPNDIEETEVGGQKNYWVRSKIVGGDYGREEYIVKEVQPSSDPTDRVTKKFKTEVERKYNLPIIRGLTINYSFDTTKELQYCLTYNNLDFQDRTLNALTQGKFFQPFVPLEDTQRSLYLGFDRPLTGGPIRIFFAAKELPFTEEMKPKLEWTYSAKTDWKVLSYLDDTEGLIMADILEFIGTEDLSAQSRFGSYLYWIKGSLTEGEYEESPLLDGIYLNTTWALQAGTIKDEILGSSDGEPNQIFSFQKFPVLEGQAIRVRETISEEEKQDLIISLGENAIFEVKDERGNVTETWVLWKEVPDFFDSGEKDRHYTLDRATGQIQFGDGTNGMIPPGGDNNIKAFSYQAGGGKQGNVKAGEIKTLKSAVPGVDKASNPVVADGGADTATLDQMLEIGPAMISHRSRAVTAEDFEWLAKEASRKVVKVRCLPNINNRMETEVGWVTVIIVPDSLEDKPFPSMELRRKVRKYLEAHCANTLASMQRIHVKGPSYVEIDVSADVFVVSIDVASEVERQVRAKLDEFFHPLTGGPEGNGWDFGRDVSASDIYAFLENIEGVDHVENLTFTYNGTTGADVVEIEQDYLVATGTHRINIQLTQMY